MTEYNINHIQRLDFSSTLFLIIVKILKIIKLISYQWILILNQIYSIFCTFEHLSFIHSCFLNKESSSSRHLLMDKKKYQN